MFMIGLTDATTGKPLYIVAAHVVSVWEEVAGGTAVGVADAYIFHRVKETVTEVVNLLQGNPVAVAPPRFTPSPNNPKQWDSVSSPSESFKPPKAEPKMGLRGL